MRGYQTPFTEIAVQLLLKQLLILDSSDPHYGLIARSLLGSIFRGINVEVLVDSVQGTHRAHGGYGSHEHLFIGLLKEVMMDSKKGVLSFSPSDLYETALIEDQAKATVVDAAIEEKEPTAVKFSEIRRWLRTSHDRERFDLWLEQRKKISNITSVIANRSTRFAN